MDEMNTNQTVMNLIDQLIAIKEQTSVSLGQLMVRTGNKYSKATLSHLFAGRTENPNLETFVDMCNALGVRIILETDISNRAEVQDSIEEFRVMYNDKCAELEDVKTKANDTINLSEKHVTDLTGTVERLRDMLDKKDEDIRSLMDDIRRKDKFIHAMISKEKA